MRKMQDARDGVKPIAVEVHEDDQHDIITIRVRRGSMVVTPGDELVPLNECGLDEKTRARLVRSGELPARKLGRRWFTKRSALLALIDEKPRPSESATPADPREAARATYADVTRLDDARKRRAVSR